MKTRLFEESIPRGGSVIDADAGSGHYTLIAARQVGQRGDVIALEPNPNSYRELRANVRRNSFEDRVIALPLGIRAWSKIPILDSAASWPRVDVVKLAVRDGEIEALRAMREAFALSPSARVFADCNPAALARAGTSAERLLAELCELGFRSHVIEEIHGELAPAGTWLNEVVGDVQLLCEPASVRRRLVRRVRTARRDALPEVHA